MIKYFNFYKKITKQTCDMDRLISDKSYTLNTVKIQTLGGRSWNDYISHMYKKRKSSYE